MKLDSEEQRQLILVAINAANWPGKVSEHVVVLKRAVATAAIENPEGPSHNSDGIREEVGAGLSAEDEE